MIDLQGVNIFPSNPLDFSLSDGIYHWPQTTLGALLGGGEMPRSHLSKRLFEAKLVAVEVAETIIFLAFVVLGTVHAIRFIIGLLGKQQ